MNALNYGENTKSSFDAKMDELLNPNSPSTLKVTPFQSYRWILSILSEVNIEVSEEINSAWKLFINLPDSNLKFLNTEIFSLGINGYFNNGLLSREIQDGSLVFGYFPGNPFVFRSIDEMVFSGISENKSNQLKKYLPLDNKSNLNSTESEYEWYDTTPISKMIFSEKGYKTRWEDLKNQDMIGKPLRFVPINHIGIFYNNHLFNLTSKVFTEAPEGFRVVAHYPFKMEYYKKFASNGENITVTNNTESSFLRNLNSFESVKNIMKKVNF